MTRRIARLAAVLLVTLGAMVPTTPASSAPADVRLRDLAGLTAWHGHLLFLASDAEHGRALWSSDGTDAGTTLVRVVNPSMTRLPRAELEQFAKTSRALYFVTDDGVHGDELWRTDGTATGTRLVRDLTPGAGGSTIRDLAAVGHTLFFARSSKKSPTPRLWSSDGTRRGTVTVPHRRWPAPTSPEGMYAWHGSVYFAGTSPRAGGTALWRSDGTAGGTRPVRDLRPDSTGLPVLTDFAGGATWLYFVGSYGTGSRYDEGVWRTDGTARHTRLVSDVDGQRSVDHTHTADLTTQGDRLLFVDNDCAHGKEPWSSDGTAAGTVLLDLDPASASTTSTCTTGSHPQALTAQGGQFLLVADDPGAEGAPTALYRSDGTPEGTAPYLDLPGTDSGTTFVDASARVGDRYFLEVRSAGEDGGTHVLYVTDGTAAGTAVARDFDAEGPASFMPGAMTGADGLAFFVGYTDDVHHQVLWVSDGTPAGTFALTD